jgi:hypothetical protein
MQLKRELLNWKIYYARVLLGQTNYMEKFLKEEKRPNGYNENVYHTFN